MLIRPGKLGAYAELPTEDGIKVVGLTNLGPMSVSSPDWMPVAEVHVYRERVGPPPGVNGAPTIIDWE
jgi:hypothetical protein